MRRIRKRTSLKKKIIISQRFYSKPLLIMGLLSVVAASIFISCSSRKELEGYTYISEEYKNNNPTAMVLILGNHANAKAIPQDAYDFINGQLDNVVYGGYICAIVADGTPTKVELIEDNDFFSETAKNNTTLSNMIYDRKNQLMNILSKMNLSADSPEVDLLAAIREAGNILSGSRFNNISDKRVIIIDTGISTTGELDFSNMDFIYGKPNIESIIKKLESYEGVGILPNLMGIKVTFVGTKDGLAEAAWPQEVTTTDKKFVRDLWEKIINACNASEVKFESIGGWQEANIYTEDMDSPFPYVSVIPFFHNQEIVIPDPDSYTSNDPDLAPHLPEPPTVEIQLASATIGFNPDSENYLNKEKAINILHPYAEDMQKFLKFYPTVKIWIVGTSATTKPDGDGSIELSLNRALTVKNTLVSEFDIPDENLTIIGLGAKFPWAINAFPNGSFATELAQSNRAVWILTEDSEKFQDLKQSCSNGELLPEVTEKLKELLSDHAN